MLLDIILFLIMIFHHRIQSVTLEITDSFNTGKNRAVEVEECLCPEGYKGLSCEDCAVGYTRNGQGLYLEICEPCTCNGHSNHCDPDSGICVVRYCFIL